MKKMLVGLSIVLLALVAFSGCGGDTNSADNMENFSNQVNKITVTNSHDTDPTGIQGKLYGKVTKVINTKNNQTFIKVNVIQLKLDGSSVGRFTDSDMVLLVMTPSKVKEGDTIEATINGQKTEEGYALTALFLRQVKDS